MTRIKLKEYVDLEDKIFHIRIRHVGKRYPDDSRVEIQFEILELREFFYHRNRSRMKGDNMRLLSKCDKCSKEITSEQIYANDDYELCEYCHTVKTIDDLKEHYVSQYEWLQKIHMRDLEEMKKEIEALTKKLKTLNQKEENK